MKNKSMFGIIAMVAIVGLSFAACDNGNDPGGGGTAPTITTESLPGGTVGTAYSETLEATGDTPVTWSLAGGALPTGLDLAADGAITGTPTVANTFGFTVKATNAAGTDTKSLSITIDTAAGGTAPKISTTTLQGGTVGTAYSRRLTATGATPVTWSIDSGTLPMGLNLATTGTIAGTPTTEGMFTFTVKAANAAGDDTKELSIRIANAGGGNQISVEMVQIQGGTFTMGSPTTEPGRFPNETQHQVTLTGFYMGKYLVTQVQYQAVMGSNPSNFTTSSGGDDPANRPVERVSWYDALVFCNKLSMNEDLSPAYSINGSTDPTAWGTVPTSSNATWNAVEIVAGSTGYRLPTEAQWEYACRARTTTAFNWGTNTINSTQANYDASYVDTNNTVAGTDLSRTTEVGSYAPNAWDLYDMHGNVFEWCWDWNGTYDSGTQTNPTGAVFGIYRVIRGGSYFYEGRSLRSAYRFYYYPENGSIQVGIRLVRPAE